ncbi:unnamed protein product [Aspergillus oryzae]|nr:unnamed protein product [Aspergillus oryzae]
MQRFMFPTRHRTGLKGIEFWVPDWPAYSPDINPIEYLWNLLKKKLLELYPELFLGGRSQIDWTQFRESIQAAWWAIPQE